MLNNPGHEWSMEEIYDKSLEESHEDDEGGRLKSAITVLVYDLNENRLLVFDGDNRVITDGNSTFRLKGGTVDIYNYAIHLAESAGVDPSEVEKYKEFINFFKRGNQQSEEQPSRERNEIASIAYEMVQRILPEEPDRDKPPKVLTRRTIERLYLRGREGMDKKYHEKVRVVAALFVHRLAFRGLLVNRDHQKPLARNTHFRLKGRLFLAELYDFKADLAEEAGLEPEAVGVLRESARIHRGE
ncbi:MAG: hypothetical protein NUV69_00960 [Candidatus Curtissbacteria bacterium]|nr:hypothetical protein [Candidatus Curtissbacteria bacterium]